MPILYLVVQKDKDASEGILYTSLTEAKVRAKSNCDIYYCECQLITPILETIYKL